MLKPIPSRILKSTATVSVCSGVDRYQNQTYTEYTVAEDKSDGKSFLRRWSKFFK